MQKIGAEAKLTLKSVELHLTFTTGGQFVPNMRYSLDLFHRRKWSGKNDSLVWGQF